MTNENSGSPRAGCSQASRISLGDNMDIAGVGKLHAKLKKCVARDVDVNIVAGRVEYIDTPALQVLLVFVRQIRENGHSVNWRSPSEALLEIAGLIGMLNELGLTASNSQGRPVKLLAKELINRPTESIRAIGRKADLL